MRCYGAAYDATRRTAATPWEAVADPTHYSEAETPHKVYVDNLDMLFLILNLIKLMSQYVVRNDLNMIARRGALHC
eukprot:15392146-Heterocapsa_arctica.AAC.1